MSRMRWGLGAMLVALAVAMALRSLGSYLGQGLWLGAGAVALLAVIAVAGYASLGRARIRLAGDSLARERERRLDEILAAEARPDLEALARTTAAEEGAQAYLGRYFVAVTLLVGLVGTFAGLMETVRGVAPLLRDSHVSALDVVAGPLQGLDVTFGASLVGILVTLALALVQGDLVLAEELALARLEEDTRHRLVPRRWPTAEQPGERAAREVAALRAEVAGLVDEIARRAGAAASVEVQRLGGRLDEATVAAERHIARLVDGVAAAATAQLGGVSDGFARLVAAAERAGAQVVQAGGATAAALVDGSRAVSRWLEDASAHVAGAADRSSAAAIEGVRAAVAAAVAAAEEAATAATQAAAILAAATERALGASVDGAREAAAASVESARTLAAATERALGASVDGAREAAAASVESVRTLAAATERALGASIEGAREAAAASVESVRTLAAATERALGASIDGAREAAAASVESARTLAAATERALGASIDSAREAAAASVESVRTLAAATERALGASVDGAREAAAASERASAAAEAAARDSAAATADAVRGAAAAFGAAAAEVGRSLADVSAAAVEATSGAAAIVARGLSRTVDGVAVAVRDGTRELEEQQRLQLQSLEDSLAAVAERVAGSFTVLGRAAATVVRDEGARLSAAAAGLGEAAAELRAGASALAPSVAALAPELGALAREVALLAARADDEPVVLEELTRLGQGILRLEALARGEESVAHP